MKLNKQKQKIKNKMEIPNQTYSFFNESLIEFIRLTVKKKFNNNRKYYKKFLTHSIPIENIIQTYYSFQLNQLNLIQYFQHIQPSNETKESKETKEIKDDENQKENDYFSQHFMDVYIYNQYCFHKHFK